MDTHVLLYVNLSTNLQLCKLIIRLKSNLLIASDTKSESLNVFCFAPDALMGPSENIRACLCGRPSVLQLFNTRCEAYYWTNNWDFIQFRCSICSGSTSAWHLKCGISQPREIENYNIFLPRLSLSLIALMNTRSANVLGRARIYTRCKVVKM